MAQRRNVNEDSELEDPQNWDWDNATKGRPTRTARAIVSVGFPGVDFDRVSLAAEHDGKKTSQFIREAAVERASSILGHAGSVAHIALNGGDQNASFVVASITGITGPTGPAFAGVHAPTGEPVTAS